MCVLERVCFKEREREREREFVCVRLKGSAGVCFRECVCSKRRECVFLECVCVCVFRECRF